METVKEDAPATDGLTLDSYDLRCLAKVRSAGVWFDDDRSLRPMELEKRGLLAGALRVWRRSRKGAEYRKSYTVTDAGRAALSTRGL